MQAQIERFQKQAECLVKQYSSYTINGQPLNGKQTLGTFSNFFVSLFGFFCKTQFFIHTGENIADNGGLKAAYHAFMNWTANHKENLPLPGLNMTHSQLFFLSFAQVVYYYYSFLLINKRTPMFVT